jgi:hypothetical protein
MTAYVPGTPSVPIPKFAPARALFLSWRKIGDTAQAI